MLGKREAGPVVSAISFDALLSVPLAFSRLFSKASNDRLHRQESHRLEERPRGQSVAAGVGAEDQRASSSNTSRSPTSSFAPRPPSSRQRIEEGRKQRGYYESDADRPASWSPNCAATRPRSNGARPSTSSRQILDEMLPEAFAVVKNACRRLCGQEITVRGHPLQVGHDPVRRAAHRRHGAAQRARSRKWPPAKARRSSPPCRSISTRSTGRGAHVVTVNDYLAARDSEWMGAVYKFLGLTVGCILHDQPPHVRREQYNCDITYGTNAEFGFDYLRDNGMAIAQGGAGPARPLLRHRGRSGLDPD